MNWKKLPIETYPLKEMTMSGNGKDCELIIKTKDPDREVSFTMRDPSLVVNIEGNITTESFNYGDLDLGLKYRPNEEIVILTAEIDFPGDEAEWMESLERYKDGDSSFIGWMIQNVKINLACKNDQ